MVQLKYLSSLWWTLEMSLMDCEINLVLTWTAKCMLSNDAKTTTSVIAGTKLYVPVYQLKAITISIKSNNKSAKLIFKLLNWCKQ